MFAKELALNLPPVPVVCESAYMLKATLRLLSEWLSVLRDSAYTRTAGYRPSLHFSSLRNFKKKEKKF